VPHPWRRTWIAIATGMLTMPSLVDALLSRRHGRAAALACLLLLPYLSTSLEPGLKKKYNFEYALAAVEARREGQPNRAKSVSASRRFAAVRGAESGSPQMRRAASEAPLTCTDMLDASS